MSDKTIENNKMPAEVALVVLDRMHDPIVVFDASTLSVTYLNRAAQALATAMQIKGNSLADLAAWLGVDRDEAMARFANNTPSQDDIESLEVSHPGYDFDVKVQRPPYSGLSDQIVAVFNDITIRRENDRLKQEVVSTVSHELRAPLTAIKGAMGLVLAGTAGDIPQRAHDMIQIAQRNADRLILILNDILDLEKMADGAMVFDNVETALADVIDTAVEAISGYSDRFDVGVTVLTEIADATSFVDPNRMVQVLVNLLSNAIKFSPAAGDVTLRLSDHGMCYRISITDNGEGIPDEEQKFLFQRFVQIGAKNRAAVGGTGLGLSIVQAILEKQGGQISFDSRPGKGTTFFVDLPKSATMQSAGQQRSVQSR